jgi:ApaG protein
MRPVTQSRMPKMPDAPTIYEAITRGVTVRVKPEYLPEQSNRERGRWVWSYTIEIENRSGLEIQLVSRHWVITDALNRIEEVKGPGVVGEQPELKPGEAYRYASACPLPTSSGLMQGAFQMVTPAGEQFDVEIPVFSLDVPGSERRLN